MGGYRNEIDQSNKSLTLQRCWRKGKEHNFLNLRFSGITKDGILKFGKGKRVYCLQNEVGRDTNRFLGKYLEWFALRFP